jgi:threonine dehydrogenase-like Zn-dependent dehydrogenase
VPTTSLAAVITAYHEPLEILPVQVPDLAGMAMLVRVDATTLCGTDVHRWEGGLAADAVPYITGHEPCGFIEEMASPRTDIFGEPLAIGDRVVWSYVACGHCYYCTVALQPCLCRGRASWGHNRTDRFPYLLGSVAQLIYVPDECHVVRVPESVSSASAAASSCAYRTIMHGYDRLGAIKAHETVLIQGSGPLGIFAAAVARSQGAKQVLVTGAPAGRLEMAARMGVDATLDIGEVSAVEDRITWIRDLTAGRGADVVIQAATNAAVPEGLAMLRDGGRFVSVGVGGRAEISVPALPGEMTMYTVRSGEPRHWLQAIDFLSSHANEYPFEEMISARYGLDGVNEAMSAMANFSVVKAAIYPNGAPPKS